MENYSEYKKFVVKNKEIYVLSVLTDYGINTIAEIDNQNYYLSQPKADVHAAIAAYELMSGQKLSEVELSKIL